RAKSIATAQKHVSARRVFEQVKSLPQFKAAKNILCYWALADELPTQEFILETALSKTIFLPVVTRAGLLIKEFRGIDHLSKGDYYKILEPTQGEAIDLEHIDLAIIPAVAFDTQGTRIGRGMAYYDRLLAKAKCYKIGVCFNLQMFPCLPFSAHDVPMDKILWG
ncbi:MAG: 5-formyltetrahydrofolate cyclo-ligase, partial [Bacteroidales bacterium]